MQVQRLSVHLGLLFSGALRGMNSTHAGLASVTHLDVFDRMDSDFDGADEICSRIPTLPSFTHLCLNNQVHKSHIDRLLRDCPMLELLLVLFSPRNAVEAFTYALSSPSTDIRFVVTTGKDLWSDWEAGAMGFPDNWSRVVKFVDRRRNGSVEASRCWLPAEPAVG
ncbi:hypothetical protein C8R46DRAFT_1123974 [Mycena filopes]|nr:hypothetical protein C8R46DRAFT_1123974 [Mycena filopes]